MIENFSLFFLIYIYVVVIVLLKLEVKLIFFEIIHKVMLFRLLQVLKDSF